MIKSRVRLYELIIHLSHLHRRCTRLKHFWRSVTRSQVGDEGAPVGSCACVEIRVRRSGCEYAKPCVLSSALTARAWVASPSCWDCTWRSSS